jgi:hypothetical protein
MNYETEIRALAAETIALQWLFIALARRLSATHPDLHVAVSDALDDAANLIEMTAIKLGESAHPDHTIKALGIVEQIRAATLGDQ